MIKMIRWDKLPDNFDKTIRDRMLQNFWLPEKYPISNDLPDWKTLDDKQKRVFNLTLGGLTLLDTYQTEAVTSLMKSNKDIYEISNLAIISQQECYHKDTEVLTPNGWKLIKDMNIGDDIYEYDFLWNIKKTKVKNVIHKNIKPTQLIEVKKDSYHTCVTPNHGMDIFENGNYKKIKAKELLNKDYINNNKIEVISNTDLYCSNYIGGLFPEHILYAFINSLKFNIDKLYHKKYIDFLIDRLQIINYNINFVYDNNQYYKFVSLKDKNNKDVIDYKYDITKMNLGELQNYLDLFLSYLNYNKISNNSYIDDYILELNNINLINELKIIFDKLGYYYKMINDNKIYFERSFLINHDCQYDLNGYDIIKLLILEKGYINKDNNYVIEFDKSDPIRMRLNSLDTSLFDREDTVDKCIYVFKNLRFNFNLDLLSSGYIYDLIEQFQIINKDKGNIYTGNRKDIFTALVTLNGGTFIEENDKVIFNLNSNVNNLLQITNENISLTKPETEVHCVSVESDTIITKYKGRLAINGNCVHAASYSNIFMTLLSTSDIDQLVRDVEASEYNKRREYIINDMYNQKDYFIKRAASVFLETFTFYSGFYYVLYLNTKQKMMNSGDTIRSILLDEAAHGGYIGYKARNYYNNKADNTIKQYLNSLMDNEVRYVQYLYDDIGLTSDVIKFLHYNANRALMNLGLDHLMYSREKSNCSEAIKAAISDESTNHDFFTTVGNTTSYQIAKAEETNDDDWN